MQSLSVGARLLQGFRTFGRASRPSSPLPELVTENETDDLNKSIFFNIGSRVIELPAGHKLPIYQNLHRLYDRFLPVMGMYLPSRSDHVIVDVGANVGDTAASMLDSCVHNFLCVEGHAPFFDMLCSNVKRQLMAPDRFILVNEVVGTGDFVGNLKANESTAHIEVEPCGRPVRSLDSIVAEHQLLDKVALLKIDTDGFDGDVLLSRTQIINRSEPLIYWENQFCDDEQLNLLEGAYEHLSKNGYNHHLLAVSGGWGKA
jgi:FkbM family methyltransferase